MSVLTFDEVARLASGKMKTIATVLATAAVLVHAQGDTSVCDSRYDCEVRMSVNVRRRRAELLLAKCTAPCAHV